MGMADVQHWEVVVVGAGAAGLVAAFRAAERGRRTLLLEKNRRPGAKILISGGTRCNLTHATDRHGIIRELGPQGRFLHSALSLLGPQEVVEMFEALGVATKVEQPTGKIFPASDKALDVLNALVRRLDRSGCVLACEEPLQ
jgi:predicted flavoprotein YhiN